MSVREINIPCCQHCFDWMRPTLAVEYPFVGCIWVCLNGCATLTEGFGSEPEEDDARFLRGLARQLVGV